jgi:PAS domain S-box-containing protein
LLFGLFIVACGTTHLLDMLMFSTPLYRLAGLVKLITVAASWGTVLALVRFVPRALAMETPEKLEYEIAVRRGAEEKVRSLNAELEARVMERTAELQASNNRFAAIVASSAHIVWTRDIHGQFATPQPSWSAFTGQSFEDLRDEKWLEAIHPDDRERVASALRHSVETSGEYKITYRMRRHDGAYRFMEVNGVPVHDESGAIREWVGTNLDVTERRETEAELRESEARFRRMVESNLVGVITFDLGGVILDCNDAFLETIGYTRDDLDSGKVDWQAMTPPEYSELDARAVQELEATGRHGAVEKQYFRKDGSRADILVAWALFDQDSSQGIGVVVDISSRKRAEAGLRESEARKSAILQSALDCIISIDLNSRIIEWNPAAEKTFGYARAEVIGQSLPELIIPLALRQAHLEGMTKYLATGEGVALNQRIEVPALRRDGSEFPIELAITRIAVEGEPLFTAYLRDITQRRQAEIDLQRARRCRNRQQNQKPVSGEHEPRIANSAQRDSGLFGNADRRRPR